MKHLRLFESFNKLSFKELDELEIENRLLEFIDRDDLRFYSYEKYDRFNLVIPSYFRIYNLYGDKFNPISVSLSNFMGKECISFMIDIPHPGGIRGNLYIEGFTRDVINRYLKKIHDLFDVDIFYQILETNYLEDWIAKVRIFITPKQSNISESYQDDEMKEYIESFFVELGDHKDDFYPITVNVYKRKVGKNKYDGYQVHVDYDHYDHYFIEKKKELIKKRLKPEFIISSTSTDKIGVRWKDVPVHGTDRTSRVADPVWRWSISLVPKIEKVHEVTIPYIGALTAAWTQQAMRQQKEKKNDTTLIIVDVQKSFKKWFTENYVNELKKYAQQFTHVYQIWDNHHQGKNVDKDYLYDKDPEIPIDKDLYTFPNQKELIEKRYNYDVDADFYKKVLDEEIYNKIKSSKLNKGDYFPTTEGTIIVYIGNNHQWFHVPIKLYKLLKSLVGKQVTIVGGSDSECLEDIVTTCESLGVNIKRDWKYIYSATHCPIH